MEPKPKATSGLKMPELLVKTKKRVADHGEVFTPSSLVGDMLNLVDEESRRIDSRFLEPACGSGNFLLQVLIRKLTTVERKHSKSEFEKRHYALFGLMCIYGIELLEDNVTECRQNLLEAFAAYLNIGPRDALYRCAVSVLDSNLVHADALTMRTHSGAPIIFSEWAYRGRGRYQRRDFQFESMTKRAAFDDEGTLFADSGKHEIFTPVKEHGLMTVEQIAELGQ